MTTEFIQTVLKKVTQAKPDIICLTGDIVDGDPKFIQSKIELLKNLQAPLGVFFVAGNHEYYWKINSILSEIKRLGIVVLENSWQVIHRGQAELLVAGIPDPAARMFGQQGPDWHAFLPALKDSQQYRLVLSHQPHQAKAAAKVGFHLQLSGHTHGGQFFPWNLLIRTAQRYPRGHFKVQDLHLYVNEGTAYWGPAVRFGTKCEITEKVLLHPDENSEIKV